MGTLTPQISMLSSEARISSITTVSQYCWWRGFDRLTNERCISYCMPLDLNSTCLGELVSTNLAW